VEQMTIGEVAQRTGVATSALRFYEREGLIDAGRSDGGQRRYPRDVLRRVAFVRAAQTVGLSLDDIRAALASLPRSRTPTKAVNGQREVPAGGQRKSPPRAWL